MMSASAGAVAAPEDGSTPDGYEIKGNASSMKYHVPGGRYYDATIAEVFFDTTESAEAAGYEAPVADEAAVEELHDQEVEAAAETADVQGIADVEGTSETVLDLPAGAVAAPEDGTTPEGYEIKGNASSKKYHVPGSRWYDQTTAEVWFSTVEEAKAAGFEPAGGEAAQKMA